MRILEASEVQTLQPMIDLAIAQAMQSPCQKSQRGAILCRDMEVLGQGFNHPMPPNLCIPRFCYGICALYAIHAELVALYDAISKGYDLSGALFVHERIKDGIIAPSSKTSCATCGPQLLRVQAEMGLEFGGLVTRTPEGHKLVTIEELAS